MTGDSLGWGRLDAENLRRIMVLHTVYVRPRQADALPGASARLEHLLAHVLDSLAQAASGKAVPGALGKPGDRVLVIAGHDTNSIQPIGYAGPLLGCLPVTPRTIPRQVGRWFSSCGGRELRIPFGPTFWRKAWNRCTAPILPRSSRRLCGRRCSSPAAEPPRRVSLANGAPSRRRWRSSIDRSAVK